MKTCGSPQTLPPTQHSFNSIKMYTIMSVSFHHTPNQWHDPLPWWVKQHHLHTFTNSLQADRLSSSQTLPVIAPGSSSSLTDGLGFGQERVRVRGVWQRVKGHHVNRIYNQTIASPKPRTNCGALTHVQTAHSRLGMLTSQIRLY